VGTTIAAIPGSKSGSTRARREERRQRDRRLRITALLISLVGHAVTNPSLLFAGSSPLSGLSPVRCACSGFRRLSSQIDERLDVFDLLAGDSEVPPRDARAEWWNFAWITPSGIEWYRSAMYPQILRSVCAPWWPSVRPTLWHTLR